MPSSAKQSKSGTLPSKAYYRDFHEVGGIELTSLNSLALPLDNASLFK